MTRRGGWRREGSRKSFRYVDSRGKRITDPDKLERIEALAIPPAWTDVWISPRPSCRRRVSTVRAERSTCTTRNFGPAWLFRYEYDGSNCNLTDARLNEYIREHMGEEFTAKDFRT